jgi:hypothetical protein
MKNRFAAATGWLDEQAGGCGEALRMINKVCLTILGLVLGLSLSAGVAPCQDDVIVSLDVGECRLTVEANDQWHTLRLRAHHPQYRPCHIDRESMLAALGAAFLKTERPKLEGSYSSLFIGRLIDYPWLSQHLAFAALNDKKGWDSRRGKPVTTGINAYVAKVVSAKPLLAQIEPVFIKNGYRVVGVEVEKVLVGGFAEVPFYPGELPPGRVPYDAMVWFRLEKN